MWPVQTVRIDTSSSVLLQASSETLCSEFKIIFLSLAKWFWIFVWKMPRSTAHWFKDKTHISLKGFHSSNNFNCCTGKETHRLYIVSKLLHAPLGYLLFLHPVFPHCMRATVTLMTGCDMQGDQQSPQGLQATLISRVDENQNENMLLGVKKRLSSRWILEGKDRMP